MRTNVRVRYPHGFIHEGAPVTPMTTEQALRRSVLSCFLYEAEFYEDGEEISDRIVRLASTLRPGVVAAIAIEGRERGNLRHMPLLLLSVLARIGRGDGIVADTIERVIQRADELAEFLAVHAKVNKVHPSTVKKTISAQMKKGLGRAFCKFDEYQLSEIRSRRLRPSSGCHATCPRQAAERRAEGHPRPSEGRRTRCARHVGSQPRCRQGQARDV
jgi:60 kDa SS-A/Ro ribonucleoprotein